MRRRTLTKRSFQTLSHLARKGALKQRGPVVSSFRPSDGKQELLVMPRIVVLPAARDRDQTRAVISA
jgi:hypothetical protein